MLGQNVNCDACGKLFDESLECCPYCLKPNPEVQKKIKGGFYLTRFMQLLLFVLGLFGYLALSLLVSAIAKPSFPDVNVTYHTLVTCTSYGIIFLTFIILLIPSRKIVLAQFKHLNKYLWGLLFGIGIMGISLGYTNFLYYVCHIGTNENQNLALEIIKTYPALAIIFLGIIGPLVEELTYRVGLFSLLSRYKRWLAYLIACIIFGFIHFDYSSKDMIVEWCNLPGYIVSGFLFCLAYDLFGLPCSAVAHIFNNLFSIIFTILRG